MRLPPGPDARRAPRAAAAALVAVLALGLAACEPRSAPEPADGYTFRTAADDTAAVKVYMGREIAPVTASHDTSTGAADRDPRAVNEFPDRVVEALDLRPTDVVADIGAGTGYFTFRLSPRVPRGRVLAVDIMPAMLAAVEQRAAEGSIDNVETILGTEDDPRLPTASVDVALIVGSYHEFSHPREMMERIVEALRPGGRVVLVEYRAEDPTLPVPRLHTMSQEQARREMGAVGLVWRQTKDILPQQHFMVFEKPARAPVG